MTDTPAPYDPSQPLRADATDEDMRDRLNFLLVDKGYWPGAASVELAREFAATLVAAERAKIRRAIRSLPGWQPNIADGGRSMVTKKRGRWLHRADVIEALPERNTP